MALTYHINYRGVPGTLIYITGSDGVSRGAVIPAMTLDDGTGSGSPLGSAANPLNVTSGSSSSKMAATYNSTLPTYTTGQIADVQADNRGALYTVIKGNSGSSFAGVAIPGDAQSNTQSMLLVNGFNQVFNGTSWDRQKGDTVSAFSRTPPTTKTASAVTAGSTSSQQLFAASATRSKVLIQNQDAAINIFVNVGAAAVAGAGNLRIAPGATLELTGTSEAINLIAASGTPAICAWQF